MASPTHRRRSRTWPWRFPDGHDGNRAPDPAGKDSRKRAGVHERTFLQSTPMGDLVIVTLEGDDPGRSFGQLMTGTDEFSKWFTEQAMAAHGDFSPPASGSPSELVVDSERS